MVDTGFSRQAFGNTHSTGLTTIRHHPNPFEGEQSFMHSQN